MTRAEERAACRADAVGAGRATRGSSGGAEGAIREGSDGAGDAIRVSLGGAPSAAVGAGCATREGSDGASGTVCEGSDGAALATRGGGGCPGSGRADVLAATRSSGRGAAEPLMVDDLEVWVTRKRVKNVNLRVRADDGRVAVSAPPRTSDAFIAGFVRQKRPWIDARLHEVADSPRAHAAAASPEEVAAWKAVVSACVPALIEAWEPLMGVRAGKVVYRNMTSRWGSCQPSTGRICINVRLVLYPPECLEYVVVHELCHLIERGHGPRFQAAMDRFMPDWRARRAKLR